MRAPQRKVPRMLECCLAENMADAIWSVGSDGRWRRTRDYAKILRRKQKHVAKALEVLVKYGFAESIDRGETLFRIAPECPSPMEMAELVASLRVGSR